MDRIRVLKMKKDFISFLKLIKGFFELFFMNENMQFPQVANRCPPFALILPQNASPALAAPYALA